MIIFEKKKVKIAFGKLKKKKSQAAIENFAGSARISHQI